MLMSAFMAQYLKEKKQGTNMTCAEIKSEIIELLQAKGHSGFTLAS